MPLLLKNVFSTLAPNFMMPRIAGMAPMGAHPRKRFKKQKWEKRGSLCGVGGTYFFLLFESHLRTVLTENLVSNVAQATFYTKIVEFLARDI